MATLPPPTHTLHVPHKHTLAQGSFGRSSIVRPPVLSLFVHSSDRSIVRPFVRPNNLCPAVARYAAEIPIVRSFDHSILRPFVHSSYSSFIIRS
jgi:hypothetical protein